MLHYYADEVFNCIPVGDFLIKQDTLLIGYIGDGGDVTIPNGITAIGNSAFANCSTLTFVVIPNSVETIGDYAFNGCSGLTSVTIPNSVTTIGEYAFCGCSGLTSITIPNSVTTIGNWAFYGCSGLTSVTIPNSVTTIGSSAFYKCSGLTKTNYTGTIADWCKIRFDDNYANPMYYSHNFYINDVEVKDLVIPGGVDTIGNYAFYWCSGLTSVTIPNSVTTIGRMAFYGCSGLVDIYCYATIPPSCEYASDFDGVSEHCYIHVPTGTKRAYELAVGWSHFIHFFEISEISGETTGEVGVEVTANTAIFSWPVNPTASSYTLVIKKNDEVFCTLTFNSLGQLVGMAFAPARNRNQQSSATVYGYSFVVSNLDASSTYDYIFTAKDNTDQILSTQSGSFTTEEVTDLFSVPYNEREGLGAVKFIKDGRLLIERNGVLFNARGARVK